MSFFKELRLVWVFIFFGFLLNTKIRTPFFIQNPSHISDAFTLPFFDGAKLLTTKYFCLNSVVLFIW